ncbi:MAG: FIST N-terminal domain-containing protein [Acidimicrobiia bacterium]
MNSFAAALSEHPLATRAVGEVAGEVLEQLGGERADLVVVFTSAHHLGALEDVTTALYRILEPRAMVGGGAVAVAGGAREVEDGPAIAAFAAHCPDASLTPARFETSDTADGPAVVGWPEGATDAHTLLLFAEPFSFPADAFAAEASTAHPELRIIGGMASAAGRGGNRIVFQDAVVAHGAVGVFVGHGLPVEPLVSQGCRPIGRPFTITRAQHNVIEELGGVSAMERLAELAVSSGEGERELIRRGLHVGLVVDEHKADFERGDFLVRNVLGVHRENGALAIGDTATVGQTVQFHIRDAAAADDDLRALLADADARGVLLFTCNGRGRAFFGTDDHDAATIEDLLGPLPLAGAFCAGELGPVGRRNFVHGFTASMALFR